MTDLGAVRRWLSFSLALTALSSGCVGLIGGYGLANSARGRLDPSGVVFQLGVHTSVRGQPSVILRRDIGGSSEPVYADESGPLLKLRGGALVSGP